LDATYLPPVAQGDLLRAARQRPDVIGIIDGGFEWMPAVYHKEILWAMHEGIHVFGSASMGALRAAELMPFGMEGVGAIFAAYLDGTLEDDDEVAIIHASAEHAFRPLSIALVNIRATLANAEREGVIRPLTRVALERLAKQRFYAERSYQRLLHDASKSGLPGAELDAFKKWLPMGQVDQKRSDALEMLEVIAARIAEGLPPKQVQYHFEQTSYWKALADEPALAEGRTAPA
jgi:hypothetical protein